LDPDCTDAQRLMVSLLPMELDNRTQLMHEVVAKAERDFGERLFEENKGHCRGLPQHDLVGYSFAAQKVRHVQHKSFGFRARSTNAMRNLLSQTIRRGSWADTRSYAYDGWN
jgi:hypothetical protein